MNKKGVLKMEKKNNTKDFEYEVGKFIVAVIGVFRVRESIDTGHGWLLSAVFLFYLFFYIGTTLPKILMFIFDPVNYIKSERKALNDMTPSFFEFTKNSAIGAVDELDTNKDRLTIEEKHRLEDALRTAEMYKYSNTHRYFGKDKK